MSEAIDAGTEALGSVALSVALDRVRSELKSKQAELAELHTRYTVLNAQAVAGGDDVRGELAELEGQQAEVQRQVIRLQAAADGLPLEVEKAKAQELEQEKEQARVRIEELHRRAKREARDADKHLRALVECLDKLKMLREGGKDDARLLGFPGGSPFVWRPGLIESHVMHELGLRWLEPSLRVEHLADLLNLG